MRHAIPILALTLSATAPGAGAAPPEFRRQVIDDAISIGYGLAIGDVDGDAKPDVLLADQHQIAWYRNGDWERFVMAEHLNPRVGVRFLDNVCIAARDLDGDGKVEVAAGANWNPGETTDPEKSGSVHYLIRPEDPTGRWEPLRLPHDPTVHRMHWFEAGDGDWRLVVLPLHGIGNRGGEGDPVRVGAHTWPGPDGGDWKHEVIDAAQHKTHNFDIVDAGDDAPWKEVLLVAGAEGIRGIRPARDGGGWDARNFIPSETGGAGEVRGLKVGGSGLIAAIEPMHGHQVVAYGEPERGDTPSRTVIDTTLNQGHALAIADLDGDTKPEIIAGWRSPDKDGKVGIKIYQGEGDTWETALLDDNGMACEDLKVADLDNDGHPDIIAAGRASKNVVIYWNEG